MADDPTQAPVGTDPSRPTPQAPPSPWAPPTGPMVPVQGGGGADDHGPGGGSEPGTGPGPAGPPRGLPGAGADGPDRRARRPRDVAAAVAAGRWVGRFAVLLLAAVLCVPLPLPWALAAVAFAVGAVVVGVLAIVALRRARLRPVASVAVGTGVGMAVLLVLAQGATLAVWPVRAELQDCLRRAVTVSAERQCHVDYEQNLQDWLPGPSRAP